MEESEEQCVELVEIIEKFRMIEKTLKDLSQQLSDMSEEARQNDKEKTHSVTTKFDWTNKKVLIIFNSVKEMSAHFEQKLHETSSEKERALELICRSFDYLFLALSYTVEKLAEFESPGYLYRRLRGVGSIHVENVGNYNPFPLFY